MVNVVTALGNVSWEQQFISSLGHPMFGISVPKRCVDGIDLLAAVRTTDVDAVVVSDAVLRVDHNCIADILAEGVRFLAITVEPNEWREVGATDIVLLRDDDISLMVQQVVKVIRDHPDEVNYQHVNSGQLTAVTGFGGASGRSQCALGVASELVQVAATCLVDADVYAPSLAQEVGLEEFTGGLLGLTRIAELRKLSDISLHETAATLENGLLFLRGIPAAHRWTDLRLHALKSMWEYLLSRIDYVVADCGPAYDLLDRNSQVTARPTRAIASLTAIDAAHTVIVTANASDVGLSRLVNGYAELLPFVENKEVIVVVHGVSDEKTEREIRILVARELGVSALVCFAQNSTEYSNVAQLICHEIPQASKTARRGIIRRRAA